MTTQSPLNTLTKGWRCDANQILEDACAVSIQVVHRLVNHPLVARDWSRRDDDPVTSQHVDEGMALRRESDLRRRVRRVDTGCSPSGEPSARCPGLVAPR